MNKIFDAHFHIIDYQFPLINKHHYLPPEFTVSDYLHRIKQLNIVGGTVVSGSFQGYDQTYIQAALKALGPTFFGVTQLPVSVSDNEILELNKQGVRAIRFNLKRGGSENIKHIKSMADRIYELAGWHVELYVDTANIQELFPILLSLPKVSIDHLGLSKAGLKYLLSLVENGVKVKATGFGRVDFNVSQTLKDIAAINPEAMMFGTDLPSTRAARPFMDDDISLIKDTVGDKLADMILYSNAVKFYNS